MSEWPRQPLVELATVTMGQSPDSAAVNGTEAGLPFLQGCAEFGERFPSPRLHCSPPLRVAKAGSTLISVRAPVGTTNRADQDYCIGRGLGAVLAKSGVADDVFLLHAIEANLEFLHRRSQGSTFLAISSKDLYSLPVPAPSLPTQRRIAEILSTLDEAIEQTEALIAKMQQVKAGLMHDLFTRGVTPDGRLRPTREQAPELYKESPLGWIPREWEVVSIEECAAKAPGATTIGPFGSNLVSSDYHSEGVPVVFVRDVNEDAFEWNSNVYVTPQKAQQLGAHIVRPGDVVSTKMGLPPCITCVYPDWMVEGVITADIIRLRPDNSKVYTRWLSAALNSDTFKRQVQTITAGVTRPKVTLSEFRKLRLPCPGIQEQENMAARFEALAAVLAAEAAKLTKLQTTKLGLMHDLLTDKVRVVEGAGLWLES